MTSEKMGDFYKRVTEAIEAHNIDQAIQLILHLPYVYRRLVIVSRLTHDLEFEIHHASVRAFRRANTLLNSSSNLRDNVAVFALALVPVHNNARALHDTIERAIANAIEMELELKNALKLNLELETQLVNLKPGLEPEIELELVKLIRMNTSIKRVLEVLFP